MNKKQTTPPEYNEIVLIAKQASKHDHNLKERKEKSRKRDRELVHGTD